MTVFLYRHLNSSCSTSSKLILHQKSFLDMKKQRSYPAKGKIWALHDFKRKSLLKSLRKAKKADFFGSFVRTDTPNPMSENIFSDVLETIWVESTFKTIDAISQTDSCVLCMDTIIRKYGFSNNFYKNHSHLVNKCCLLVNTCQLILNMT